MSQTGRADVKTATRLLRGVCAPTLVSIWSWKEGSIPACEGATGLCDWCGSVPLRCAHVVEVGRQIVCSLLDQVMPQHEGDLHCADARAVKLLGDEAGGSA